MIKVENVEVFGFGAAIRGMRNPMNSWARSDSVFERDNGCEWIGRRDIDLMHRLYASGPEHRKYLRMIHVQMDVTAPLYWWKEYDTYKVGTVANSCSTMHKVQAKKFTLEDFSTEHLDGVNMAVFENVIDALNTSRDRFNDAKSKSDWWQMIQLLPASFNQRRTLDINYEVAISIIGQRKSHKLDEWRVFCDELIKLPGMDDIVIGDRHGEKG